MSKTALRRPAIQRLREALKDVQGVIQWEESLATITSLQVGGPADVLVFPDDVNAVIQVVQGARAQRLPVTVLGGTNVVVRDKGIRGIVMHLKNLTGVNEQVNQMVYAQAGLRLPRLMQFAQGRKLSGMEWAAGIPGTVGGGVVMNAGTRLGEMKDVLYAVDMVNFRGQQVRVDGASLSFEYRKTVLPRGIVIGAWMQLKSARKEKIGSITKSYLRYRRMTQPLTMPNAGSVFKNPMGGSAGGLIEEAGLKGFRIGDAEISSKHANFIVNKGYATATDVLDLIRKVRSRVSRKFGIRLDLELKIIGEV